MCPENLCFTPYNLLCEYAPNPLGINTISPRLSWIASHEGRGYYQSAYQIIASSRKEYLDVGYHDLWDTGKVKSGQSVNIEYRGKMLSSGQICFWKVRIWDNEENVSTFSETAFFEIGLLVDKDWKAEWIGYPAQDTNCSPIFRKTVSLRKKVSKARVYISGLGYYEMRINGQKVGNHVLDPGWTDYNKRILYAVHDVTSFLKKGENVIGIMLGNGWYWNPDVIMPGAVFKSSGKPKMIMQMNIEFEDGAVAMITSGYNQGWLASTGPIIQNSIYHGETYDARLEKSGWDRPGYTLDETEWRVVESVEKPNGIMIPQMLEPIRIMGEITPVNITNPAPGIFVFDMGQNIAGWARLRVIGQSGTGVKIRYAELLYDNGIVNQENLRSARATDIYILKGDPIETYEPRFTYHGFRYVQVEGLFGTPDIEDVTGIVVRSSVETVGEFFCSNELINKIQKNAVWTEANNLHSIPTDCPQRDERLGWLNDATVRAEEAIYNFNMSRFYAKWLDDISDTQDEKTGAITNTAPDAMPMVPNMWEHIHADAVCSSYLIIPWLMYLHYGDIKILERHYEGMKNWTEFLGSKAEDCIVGFSQMGDWASPISQCVKESVGSGAVSANTPGILMSTGYYYFNARLISMMAGILKKKCDEEKYSKLAERIRKAFNGKFLDMYEYQYASGSQASNVFPMYLGIVPENCTKGVLKNIVRDIVYEHEGHLTTGNLCSKYILEVLTDGGCGEIAYMLASCDTYPSWGYMIKKGATTIWERWEEDTGAGMNSHDHPMYGSISTWFYKYLGGIRADVDGPGFEKIIIKPFIPENLEFSYASLKTVRGNIVSSWKKYGELLEIKVDIPFNSISKVYLPKRNALIGTEVIENGKIIWKDGRLVFKTEGLESGIETDEFILFEIGSGHYCFQYKQDNTYKGE